MLKLALYGVVVGCFLIAGVLDAVERNWKSAALAFLFGTANALIFFWRAGR